MLDNDIKKKPSQAMSEQAGEDIVADTPAEGKEQAEEQQVTAQEGSDPSPEADQDTATATEEGASAEAGGEPKAEGGSEAKTEGEATAEGDKVKINSRGYKVLFDSHSLDFLFVLCVCRNLKRKIV